MADHDELKSTIPAYVASRLQGEERRRLEMHLAECADCSEMVQSLKGFTAAMRGSGEEMFSPHPDVLALRGYARGEAGADSRQIARHIAGCATCELEVSAWKFRSLVEEAAPRLRDTKEEVTATRIRPSRTGRFSALSLAAGIIVGVGVAVLLRIGVAPEAPAPTQKPAPTRTATPWSGPAQLFVLSSQVRGEDSLSSWRLAADQPYVLVAIRPLVPDSAADADLYRFEIRGSDGGTVWSSDLSASRIRREMEHSEVITFPIPAPDLAPGRYEFRFSSLRPGDRQPPLGISFEVVR